MFVNLGFLFVPVISFGLCTNGGLCWWEERCTDVIWIRAVLLRRGIRNDRKGKQLLNSWPLEKQRDWKPLVKKPHCLGQSPFFQVM
uniref:Secreted protein n=1 Tax=Helianthus annuus TaxID=4232 RepID=A0A251V5U8_HELAN